MRQICQQTNVSPAMIARLTLIALCFATPAAPAIEIDRRSPRAEFTFLGGMDIKTGPGEVESYSLAAQSPLGKPIRLGGHGLLTVGLAYEATSLQIDGTPAGFPLPDADLHHFELPLIARWQRPGSPWSITAGLSPGLATDFDHIDDDDFYLGGRLVFQRTINEHFKLGFGAAVIRSLGSDAVIPAIGFEWRPTDAWQIELVGPYFNIWWQPSDQWLTRFTAGPGGGFWNVDWNNLSRDLSLSSYLVGISVERELAEGVWLTGGAGVSLANQIELRTTGGLTTFKTGLDNGYFASLGLRVAAW
jgi:hypothetical protein